MVGGSERISWNHCHPAALKQLFGKLHAIVYALAAKNLPHKPFMLLVGILMLSTFVLVRWTRRYRKWLLQL